MLTLSKCMKANAEHAGAAPLIDGNLDEDVWKKSEKNELKYLVKSNKPPVEKSFFSLGYDEKNLYLGAVLECKDISKLKATFKENGSKNLYQDDCFEFLINTNNDLNTYCHFIINSISTKTSFRKAHDKVKDALILDTQWQADWQGKSRLADNKWYIEMAIPLKELGLKNLDNSIVFFQAGRENQCVPEYSSFSPTSSFPSLQNFGYASFSKLKKADIRISAPELQKGEDGKFNMMIMAEDIKRNGGLNFDVELTNPEGVKSEKNRTVTATANEMLCISLPVDCKPESDGLYRLDIKVSGNESFFSDAYTFYNSLPVTVKYGDIILNPLPKEITWGEGNCVLNNDEKIYIEKNASERTEKTAQYLAGELHDLFGVKASILRSGDIAKQPGIKMHVTAKGEREGYSLSVEDNGIVLEGNDEAGLYYAVVSLMQLARGSMKITEKPEIRKVKIKDWPDLKYRFYTEATMWHSKTKDNPKDLEWYKLYVKRFVAGQKYNMLSFSADASFIFEKIPDLSNAKAYMSKKFQLELAALCKEHFIEYMPAIETGGHFNWVPKSKFPELFEEGFKRQSDPTKPEYYKFIFSAMNELIESTGAKYFNTCHDEWWSSPPADKTDVYKGMPRKEIFLNTILEQHKFLKSKNIKMMMFADMILKSHNGGYTSGPRKDLYTVIDKMPKDIIFINWSTAVDPSSNEYLHKHGFEVIVANNGFVPCPKDRDNLSGYGILGYGLGMLTSGVVNDKFLLQYGYAPMIRSADYAWNFKRDPGTSLKDFERERLPNIASMNAVKANPAVSAEVRPVSMENAVNSNMKNIIGVSIPELFAGQKEFGFIPMKIEPDTQNKDCKLISLTKQETVVDLKKPEKISALYFLHGVYMPDEKRKNFFMANAGYIFGIPVAEYSIEYMDGSREKTTARFGMNILDIIPTIARCRFMSDARYVWMGKTADGKEASLYLYEWINPHPEKEVKKIVLQSTGTDALPVVCAISARGVRKSN